RKDIFPPVNVLSCLSRLMKDGIGEGQTREDHQNVSDQLYAGYARAQELRSLAEIVGKAGLASIDLKYLDFGDVFEKKFLKQGYDENRTIEDTLLIAWKLFSGLPEKELTKIKQTYIDKYAEKLR
ncbi:MAG: V-type ATP synthase subunit B, partial [Nitrososphaerales archaeon]|nr:V-type ATP synthase subunit B [Nitrososphaerales archaeon]